MLHLTNDFPQPRSLSAVEGWSLSAVEGWSLSAVEG